MRSTRTVLGIGLVVLWLGGVVRAQGDFYLKDGDRVVFYGDSITEQLGYAAFVETYVLTRFPRLQVSFVNSGVGGDRTTGSWAGPVDLRLKRDVFAHKPTVVTMMLGMNDGYYKAFDQEIFENYSKAYRQIVDSIESNLPTARLTLIQPSPYDDVTRPAGFEGGYNAVLVRYGQFVKELAETKKLDVADLNTSVVAALQKAQAADPETARTIIADRVHPGQGGHLLLAASLLKAWNAPALVTAVEVDAARVQVVREENTAISDLKESNGLTWTQNDKALPMFIRLKHPSVKLAVQCSDVLPALNWQPLKITGLKELKYKLQIDGALIGTFSRQQLDEGVNLAELPTPMAKQADEVHTLTAKRNHIHWVSWRELQVILAPLPLPHRSEAIEALGRVEADLLALQRQTAQPKPHRYELLPQE